MTNSIMVSIGLILISLVALLLIMLIMGKVRSIKGLKVFGPGFGVEVDEAQMEGGQKD